MCVPKIVNTFEAIACEKCACCSYLTDGLLGANVEAVPHWCIMYVMIRLGRTVLKPKFYFMAEILDDFAMPVGTRGGAKGSAFLTDDTTQTAMELKVGQAFIVPMVDGVKPANMRYNVTNRLRKFFKEHADADQKAKQFAFALIEDGKPAEGEEQKYKGVAVKRTV